MVTVSSTDVLVVLPDRKPEGRFGPPLIVPGKGSVAPVHNSGDLADHCPPRQTCRFFPDFSGSTPGEKRANTAGRHSTECFVQVIEG
jgi:hypothetical protein